MPNLRAGFGGQGSGVGWAQAYPIPALELSNARLRNQLQYSGGTPPNEAGPGLIQRIFDVLSRPNYAIANTVKSLSHLGEEEGGNPLEEFWQGLAGKDKTRFGDVIGNEWGVTGDDLLSKATRGVGGFALDVLTDPTTYIGLGTVKPAAEGAIATGRMAALKGGAENAVKELASRETEAAVRVATAGLKGKAAKKVAEDVSNFRGATVLNESSRALAEANRKRLYLKLGLFNKRPIGGGTDLPSRVWENIFGAPDVVTGLREGGTSVGRSIATSPIVQATNRAFRTEALGPDGIKTVKAIATGQAADAARKEQAKLAQWLKDAVGADGKRISVEQLRDIYHHVQLGTHPSELLKLGYTPKQADLYTAVVEQLDRLGSLERGFGFWDKHAGNYAPVYIKRGEEEAIRAFKAGRKPATDGDLIKTSMDANAQGIETIDRIDQVMGHYISEHFQKMAEAETRVSALYHYGVNRAEIKKVLKDKTAGKNVKRAARRQLDFMDHLVREGSWKRYKVAEHGIDGYLPRRVVQSLDRLKELKVNRPEAQTLLNRYDKINSYWKAFATIVNPGHHFRNVVGDIFQTGMDGALDPRAHAFALMALGDPATGQKVREAIYNLVPFKKDVAGTPLWNIGGFDLTPNAAKIAYSKEGLTGGLIRAELTDLPVGARNPLGRTLEHLREASEIREEWPRIAHFITAARQEANNTLRKTGAKKLTYDELQGAYSRAAERVRDFHFDYLDITPFERAVVKRVIPFYTFMRKNVPAQLENIFFRPGQAAMVPKGFEAIRQLMGTDKWEPNDRVPQWLREGAYPEVGGTEEDPTYLALDLPIQEMLGRLSFIAPSSYSSPGDKVHDAFRELAQIVSPLIRDPAELALNRRFFNQQEIGSDPRSLIEYLAEQVPLGRQGTSILDPEARSDNPTSNFWGPGGLNLGANWLTGLGLQQSTPSRQEGELRRQEDVLRALLDQLGVR